MCGDYVHIHVHSIKATVKYQLTERFDIRLM